ncbi:GTP-binding protein LepA [Nocardioides antri]|uniref:GTP-binding protein LepA n=1 Tax=Nocardioides antri TaxID=2607659 RepID=UPI00165FCF2F|nr:GTP-binding protein LepA [Nocardioides antri]
MSQLAVKPRSSTSRLQTHVARLEQEHPPLDVASVDFTVRRPRKVIERYGRVLDYMARTELEVERNVRELDVLMPDPPELDQYFYRHVWGPQELQHGLILDRLQAELGLPLSAPNVSTIPLKLRVLGGIAHVAAVQDVVRMLYYLTGMTTERSAVLAYQHLHEGLVAMGEDAIADTAVAPIRRQEPGHYAYYQMSARQLWARLSPWQQWLTRRLRSISFAPVGANSSQELRQVGDMMLAFDIRERAEIDEFARTVARSETELLWAQEAGLGAPSYVADAFARCLELARTQPPLHEPCFHGRVALLDAEDA